MRQWKLVKPSPSARIVLARKKFRNYAGAVYIYYVIRTKDGRVYRYRKYTLILFWCGHGIVKIGENVRTKDFARLYGILVDNDTGERYLVKLGYDEQAETRKGVKKYYLNLLSHGHGAFVFGNQGILLVRNRMKKPLFRHIVRTSKEIKRVYTLEGWNGNLNHDIISIHPFRVYVKNIEYQGIPIRVFIIIPTRNGQELDILNHHHKSEGFDRITVKMNMNDLLLIVHQHPDYSDHELFRYREFWGTIEGRLGIPRILKVIEPYCY